MEPIQPGETWRMTVLGQAVPQGDLSAMPIQRADGSPVIGRGGRPVINQVHSNQKTLKPWRQEVALTAVANGWPGMGVAALDEALIVRITFYFPRPASHFGTGRNAGVLKDSSPLYPEKTGGDLDKLERATLDALTGIIWTDDRRVVTLPTKRRFGTPARAEIAVRRPRARTVGELRALRELAPDDFELERLQLDLFASAAV